MSTPQGKPPFGLLEERGIDGLTSSDLKATMSPMGGCGGRISSDGLMTGG
jgi:hypothetical protein